MNEMSILSGMGTQLLDAPSLVQKAHAHGLTLSLAQAEMLAICQQKALDALNRVDFGKGALPLVMQAFAASPYIQRDEAADTLAALTELFYALKSETHDILPDEALIRAMARGFDTRAGGSVEALADISADQWIRLAQDDDEEAEHGASLTANPHDSWEERHV